jgi:hypothetical protein
MKADKRKVLNAPSIRAAIDGFWPGFVKKLTHGSNAILFRHL